MNKMELNNFIQSNWFACDGGWNYWKTCNPNKYYDIDALAVVLIVNSSNLFKLDPNKCNWTIEFIGRLAFANNLFENKYKFYNIKFSEIDMYKDKINEFLINLNKLSVFI